MGGPWPSREGSGRGLVGGGAAARAEQEAAGDRFLLVIVLPTRKCLPIGSLPVLAHPNTFGSN
eukprot:7300085-Alexandrium_andersonii.AAC.2